MEPGAPDASPGAKEPPVEELPRPTSTVAGLAKEAAQLFHARSYQGCLLILHQLQLHSEEDPKVCVLITPVLRFCLSGKVFRSLGWKPEVGFSTRRVGICSESLLSGLFSVKFYSGFSDAPAM